MKKSELRKIIKEEIQRINEQKVNPKKYYAIVADVDNAIYGPYDSVNKAFADHWDSDEILIGSKLQPLLKTRYHNFRKDFDWE